MFNDVLTKLVGFFSRGFWLGHFLPVAIFGVLHLIAAKLVLGDAVDLSAWAKPNSTGDAVFVALAVMTPVVVAYGMAPSIPFLRGLLDGTLLPAGAHNHLRRQRLAHFYRQREAWNRLAGQASQLVANRPAWTESLMNAAKEGQGRATTDRQTLDLARRRNASLEACLLDARLPPLLDVRCAVSLMECVLRSHDSGAADPLAREIGAEHARLNELLRNIEGEAHYQVRVTSLRQPALALTEGPPATPIGDARTLAAQHSAKAYGVEFDYIWPRLQMIMKDEDPTQARLAAAQTQVDFSVMVLVLSVTLVVWVPLAAAYADSPLAVAVGLGAPPLILLGVRLVVASHTAFGEVVKAVIDTRRLDLLKALHQELPKTLEAERKLWNRLQTAESGAPITIDYKRPEGIPS